MTQTQAFSCGLHKVIHQRQISLTPPLCDQPKGLLCLRVGLGSRVGARDYLHGLCFMCKCANSNFAGKIQRKNQL